MLVEPLVRKPETCSSLFIISLLSPEEEGMTIKILISKISFSPDLCFSSELLPKNLLKKHLSFLFKHCLFYRTQYCLNCSPCSIQKYKVIYKNKKRTLVLSLTFGSVLGSHLGKFEVRQQTVSFADTSILSLMN